MTVKSTTTLLIDAGNTRLKWAWLAQGRLTESGVVPLSDGNAQANALRQAWISADSSHRVYPAHIVLSNVGSESIAQVVTSCFQDSSPVPQLVTVKSQTQAFGITNGYPQPSHLGVDRWVSLVAAHNLIPGAVCVVDCGTAITLDIVNSEGVHLGGSILPGLKLMKQSLMTQTAIPHALYPDLEDQDVESSSGTHFLGTDTRHGILGGILAAASGAIQQVLTDVEQMVSTPLSLIVTGGDAPRLLRFLPSQARHEPDWVLLGLKVIAETLS